MTKRAVIVTHDSGFHSDDVFGTAALTLLLGEENTEIRRSRDESVIAAGDYVIDVGMVYDPAAKRFDHHQSGGAGIRDNGIPYASFGLVWKHYGEEIAGSEEVARAIDRRLVQPIDAFDNGKELFTLTNGVGPYIVQQAFFALEPAWGETMSRDDAFVDAVRLARRILSRELIHERQNIEARKIVDAAYHATEDKRLVVVETEPTIPRVLIMEALSNYPEPLYAVRRHEESGKWQTICVVDDIHSFKNRKDLPEDWAGKRDAELVAVTGVPDATFCHNGRFMAVARSKEGALKLAELALAA